MACQHPTCDIVYALYSDRCMSGFQSAVCFYWIPKRVCIAGAKAAFRKKQSDAATDARVGLEDLAAAEPGQDDAAQPSQESDWGVEVDANSRRPAVKTGSPAAGRKPAKSRASRVAAAVKGALARSAEKDATLSAFQSPCFC